MESRDFSSDLIFEILTRTSLQTLGRCRLVCKEWNRLTYDSSFMHLYCQRTKLVSGYFIQSMTSNKYSTTFVSIDKPNSVSSDLSLDFLGGAVKIEASSNQGLLCCVNLQTRIPRTPRYFVCKPSTKQWQTIPNPKTRYFTDKTAMIVLRSNPLRYKIIRFSQPKCWSKKYYNLRCEIFDSEIWSWKQLKEVQLPYNVFLSINPSVSASGAIYWLTTHNHIFTFYENQESWKMFSLPQPLYENDYFKDKQLVEYKGQLALICMRRDEFIELWVMEDYGNKVWNKRQILSIESLRRIEPYSYPAGFYNADIALMKGFDRLIFYKFQNCSSTVVKLDKHIDLCEVYAFQSDLDPINLMGRS